MEFTLLLTGALLPAELAGAQGKSLLVDLPLPALQQLLARGKVTRTLPAETTHSASMPEYWLAQQFSVPSGMTAAYCAQLDQLTAAPEMLWALKPVHFHVARDHLVLTDPAHLMITSDEAKALCASIEPLLTALQWQIHIPHPQRWYVTPPQALDLSTTSPEVAVNQNIEPYLPTGKDARQWKRLMNEVQMVWHNHAVNQARTERGELPVNSLWLHGGANRPMMPMPRPTSCFDALYAEAFYARALANATNIATAVAPATPQLQHAHTLQIDQRLRTSLMAQDWYAWRTQWLQLEHDFFAPLRDLLGRRILKRFTLVLCGEQQIVELVITPQNLWKFWRRATLAQELFEVE